MFRRNCVFGGCIFSCFMSYLPWFTPYYSLVNPIFMLLLWLFIDFLCKILWVDFVFVQSNGTTFDILKGKRCFGCTVSLGHEQHWHSFVKVPTHLECTAANAFHLGWLCMLSACTHNRKYPSLVLHQMSWHFDEEFKQFKQQQQN